MQVPDTRRAPEKSAMIQGLNKTLEIVSGSWFSTAVMYLTDRLPFAEWYARQNGVSS